MGQNYEQRKLTLYADYMEIKLFNYDDFIRKYSKNPEFLDKLKKYEGKFGISKDTIIEEHPFYIDHLQRFNNNALDIVTSTKVNMSLQEWDLLIKLILGSTISSFQLMINEEWKRKPEGAIKTDVRICVSHKGRSVSKQLNELSTAHVKSLFEIYVKKQIELFLLGMEEDDEDCGSWRVKQQLDLRYTIYEQQMESLLKEAELYKKLQGIILW